MTPFNNRRRDIGVNFSGGEAHILLWSPLSESVEIILPVQEQRFSLERKAFGYWELVTPVIKPGDHYKFSLDSGDPLPDPASLSQPDGVHGPSQALDLTRYSWRDGQWHNPPLGNYILYELHTGTFTSQGNFASLVDKLDYLVGLGITAIEIMPVAQFPGDRNWGYDGVFPFAVQNSYGGAERLQQLVDACHAKGLAVVLDVVYNHLGPEGNYLGAFGPYFTEKYKTPWGPAINFDDAWCDGVRRYYIENALMWFRDFHIDALRLDAVHAIRDFSPLHILQEIKKRVDELAAVTGRTHYLIVELDLNDARFINDNASGGFGMDAQWIDEFHHALRVTAGEPRTGYYEDFDGISHLAKSLRDAYVYDGQYSPHRKKNFGVPATKNTGDQFIIFSQNHDQVGNRMLGERSSSLVSFGMQKTMAGAVLLAPYLPLLFMGEEWSEPNPFLYFISHTDPVLVEAVRSGRKAEFEAFHYGSTAPDPASEHTFKQSRLQWQLSGTEPQQTMLNFYKALIALRKGNPVLSHPNRKQLRVDENAVENTLVLLRWNEGHQVCCLFNFSRQPRKIPMPPTGGAAWHKIFDADDAAWGGTGAGPYAVSTSEGQTSVLPVPPESFLIYSNTHV